MTFIYDALGRLDQVKRGSTVLTDYAYNADGTIASRTDRDSGNNLFGMTNFTYDWADREQTVDATSFGFLPAIVTNTYRADGLLASRTLGNSPGDIEHVAYDAAKRPTTITVAAGTLDRAYDRVGNVKLDGRSLGGAGDAYTNDQTFSYDGNNRLIQATMQNGATSNYSYDRDGNRLSKGDAGSAFTYTYDRADQLITQSIDGGAAASFAYDALGAMTTEQVFSGSTRAFSYDAAGRLLTITPSGGTNTVNLAYDELGRTKTRVAGGVTQTYSYVGATQVTWKLDTGVLATTDTDLVDAANNRLASKHDTSTKVLVFDFLGSVAATEGSSGTSLTGAIRYDGFGKTIAGAVVSPSKFRGLQDLSANGDSMYRMGARDYSPHLGAFTSMDSIEGQATDPRTMNRFVYAASNPTSLIDPTGHAFVGPPPCHYDPEDCAALNGNGPSTPPPSGTCSSSACNATGGGGGSDNKDSGGANQVDHGSSDPADMANADALLPVVQSWVSWRNAQRGSSDPCNGLSDSFSESSCAASLIADHPVYFWQQFLPFDPPPPKSTNEQLRQLAADAKRDGVGLLEELQKRYDEQADAHDACQKSDACSGRMKIGIVLVIPEAGAGAGVEGLATFGARTATSGVLPGRETINTFETFVEARAEAARLAGLGDDIIPYVQQKGPFQGQVTGSSSRDGLRGWRIDFDTRGGKGFHVNWWDQTGGLKRSNWFYGANVVRGGVWDDFLELLQHFPKL